MKKIIRIVSLLLVLMLFVTGVPDITPVAQVQAASLSELYDELNKLNKEQSNYNSLINSANKDLDKAVAEIKRLNGKLSNESFVSKAPAAVVEQERAKLAKYEEMYANLSDRIEVLSK